MNQDKKSWEKKLRQAKTKTIEIIRQLASEYEQAPGLNIVKIKSLEREYESAKADLLNAGDQVKKSN